MYGSAQIMAVTGHKSVQSLATYHHVDTEDKIKMGRTLSENLVQEPKLKQQVLPSTATLALPSTTDTEKHFSGNFYSGSCTGQFWQSVSHSF